MYDIPSEYPEDSSLPDEFHLFQSQLLRETFCPPMRERLGLRDTILNLSLMVAAGITLLWRQAPGVQELNRLLAREGLLWCHPTKVAQQSLSERFLVFPVELFKRVFKDLLP